MKIVIAGATETSRATLKQIAFDAGHCVTGAVSAKTDLVVSGDMYSAKTVKAEALGIEVISEQEFLSRCSVNKYHRQLKGVTVDVYDVLKAFNVTCPATQHALKKMLCTGLRGHKDAETDLNEAIASLQRAKELLGDG